MGDAIPCVWCRREPVAKGLVIYCSERCRGEWFAYKGGKATAELLRDAKLIRSLEARYKRKGEIRTTAELLAELGIYEQTAKDRSADAEETAAAAAAQVKDGARE